MNTIAEMQRLFVRALLVRHEGNTQAALEELHELMVMSDYGREFYVPIERDLYWRLALERDAWRH